ncbi:MULTISPECIES: alpha-L-fucosidase [unclassified Microbacterium]|uniref:alpha-L-fucosidase n=1 Tax=unclassified Microbacterium TaxID=2609290 RepID=UPI0012FB12ED|nr:alpha-L-fucosidase [Microbacterium sp. MAH-37]MVQ43853.1 alpha-L-fucosidase [Microbacterium sp. MAH-37]
MDTPLVLPTPGQLAWQRMRIGVFFHFGLNTFHGLEWGPGDIPAADFAPSDLDADQWVSTAKDLGAEYVVITAKHHDGFCLWPTSTTEYSVASSPWRDGRGDVVAEVAAACERQGVRFGFYLSPWDRNAPQYQDPAKYDDLYAEQLRELCTGYGGVSEIWFDGAGSEGHVYDWARYMEIVAEHQPEAMIFNMGSPTIRWVGNEDGLAADPVDYVVSESDFSNYTVESVAYEEALYLPPECDVSIRRGWFWAEDDGPKSLDHLLAIYYRSVGMGANLLLNLPPDTRGLIPDEDAERLRELRAELDRRFGAPHRAVVSLVSRSDEASEWTLDLGEEREIDHLWLEEDLVDGQRIRGFELRADDGTVLVSGARIGAQRILTFPSRRARILALRLQGDQAQLSNATAFQAGTSHVPEVAYLASTDAPA